MTDARTTNATTGPARRHGVVAGACFALVATMVGASYAAVPFYQWFCKATGYAGTTQVATAPPNHVIDRVFQVRLDANVRSGLPWDFHAEETLVEQKAGDVATVNYVIENLSDRETRGMAVYNVTPELSGIYFTKLECFCFTEQVLKPHERVVVPVTFYVDAEIDGDQNLKTLKTITLSYSFFPSKTSSSTEKPVAAVDETVVPKL